MTDPQHEIDAGHETDPAGGTAVALIGTAGRFPGADSPDRLWDDLVAGRPGLRPVTDDELDAAGVDAATRDDPRYVRVCGPLAGIAEFDAPFFGFSPAEAALADPQHRLFLECCWEALEDAGHRPDALDGPVGVFAGCGFTGYMVQNLLTRPDVVGSAHKLQIAAGNDRDAIATLVSYKLGLRGPSASVQTFCSTSLASVHLAVQSLLTFESDVVLAGGTSVELPQPTGYLYEEGGIVSPDGVVRSFDARAAGTVVSNGVGVVVLKRLDDALRDGDHVRAVLLGSAMNNDGRGKVGFSAPGAEGQAAVVEDALRLAAVHPRDVGYVECHATGTMLGDSVELSAMRRAFDAVEADPESPAPQAGRADATTVLGSLKPTHGHLDRASGVSGLIRAALALEHGVLPGTPNYDRPNPALAEAGDRFTVLDSHRPWDGPRYAGVSSFGLGGTNVHCVLAAPPVVPERPAAPGPHLLTLSARDDEALDAATDRLRAHLAAHPDVDLADVAATLQLSRTGHARRRVVLCDDVEDAVAALDDRTRWRTGAPERRDPAVALRTVDGNAPWTAFLAVAPGPCGAGEDPGDDIGAVARHLAEAGLIVAEDADGRRASVEVEVDPGGEPRRAWWELIGRLWLAGVEWRWARLHDGVRRRVRLPTYPFRRETYWVEPGAHVGQPAPAGTGPDRSRRPDPGDWFHQPCWRRRPLFGGPSDEDLRARGPWLLVGDAPVLDDAVEELRAAGAEVAVLRPGDGYVASPDGPDVSAPVHRPEAIERFLAELGIVPRTVVHAAAVHAAAMGAAGTRAAPDDPVAVADAARSRGFDAVRALVRALVTALRGPTALDLLLVTAGAVEVRGGDLVDPDAAALVGLAPVVSQENPGIACRLLDLDPGPDRVPDAGLDLLAEAAADGEPVVAHRSGGRWVRDHERVAVPPADPDALADTVPPGGCVLITGGLGDVGLVVAGHLARTRGARLVLTGRRRIDETADDDVRAAAVRRLREAGASVLVRTLDAGVPDAVAAVVAEAREHFGGIDLVVHAAGVSDPAQFDGVDEMTDAQADAHFRAKVTGLLALDRALPDDVALVTLSSLAAVLGGLEFGAYAAANAALDAHVVAARARGRRRWSTVDWEAWAVRAEQHTAPGTTIADFSMAPDEALEVTDRVLASVRDLPHLVVSSGDLAVRHRDWVLDMLAGDGDDAGGAASPALRHPRPALSTPWAQPAPGAETDVAAVWAEVLGLDQVGAHDDFFELGGHSLLATQVVARLRARLAVALSVTAVLEHPTVHALAGRLAAPAGATHEREGDR